MPRSALLFTILLFLSACRNEENQATSGPPPPPPISYSREIRPLIVENCQTCHQANGLPISLVAPEIPTTLRFPDEHHSFSLDPKKEATFLRWLAEGARVDLHWAHAPLNPGEGTSVDDFLENKEPERTVPRKAPRPLFLDPITDLFAGDLSADAWRSIATNYFRRGEDTPKARVDKVSRQFLGTRLECAQCHDHPTDPVTSGDYARLLRIFTTPYDLLHPKHDLKPPLYLDLTDADRKQRHQNARKVEFLVEEQIATFSVEDEFKIWLTEEGSVPLLNGLSAAYSFEENPPRNLAPEDGPTVTSRGTALISGPHGSAISFLDQSEFKITRHQLGNESGRFTISLWLKITPLDAPERSLIRLGHPGRGFEVRFLDGKLQARWMRVWPEQAIETSSTIPYLIPGRWFHLAVSYDGSRRAEGLKLYINGQAIDQEYPPQHLLREAIPEGEPLSFGSPGIDLDELQILKGVLSDLEIAHLFDGTSLVEAFLNKEARRQELADYYVRNFDPDYARLSQEITQLTREHLAFEAELPEVQVMQSLPGLPPGDDRLSYIKSLLSGKETLLARSLANETWRTHFGSPLVEDLGYGGPMPAYPELLDWLARELLENDWNLARLGERIRSSEAWKREWPALEKHLPECPRPDKN